jgi:hypothetical protein
VILLLGAFIVAMVSPGDTQTISEQSAVTDDQYFLVENAVAAEPVFHDWLRRIVPKRQLFKPGSQRVHRIHRIAPGEGTVIGWRYAYDIPDGIDEEHSFKLTLFLPRLVPQGETLVELGAAGKDRAYAVESRNSLAWPDLACMGLVREGTVRLVRDGDHVAAEFDFVVERTGPDDVFPPGEICPTEEYRRKIRLKVIDFEDLTPWQGRAEGNVGHGEEWPVLPDWSDRGLFPRT